MPYTPTSLNVSLLKSLAYNVFGWHKSLVGRMVQDWILSIGRLTLKLFPSISPSSLNGLFLVVFRALRCARYHLQSGIIIWRILRARAFMPRITLHKLIINYTLLLMLLEKCSGCGETRIFQVKRNLRAF